MAKATFRPAPHFPNATEMPYVDWSKAFSQAEAFLAKGKSKTSRPIGNNTSLRRVDADTIAVVFHSTAVVTYHRDGTFTIYGGGWNSPTTKARISEYSPINPGSDGKGAWIVGYTGETTPAKPRKCRTCKHKGTWMGDDICSGPGWYSRCSGATTEYAVPYWGEDGKSNPGWHASRYTKPCEHGQTERHHTEPCKHGEWDQHTTGQSQRSCYRCNGTGTADYGSKPIPVLVTAYDAFKVDVAGKMLGPAVKPTGYYTKTFITTPYDYDHVSSKHTVIGERVEAELKKVLPGLSERVTHPVTLGSAPVNEVVVSLNDKHRWTRVQIADWLDTLDVDLRFPTPA